MAIGSSALLQGDDVLQAYQLNRALRRGDKPSSREEFARALLKQGTDMGPVRSPLEGLAKMLTAGVGGYFAGQERQGAADEERMMMADILGQRSQKQAEDQRQLASAGVPGFTMPPTEPQPGVAQEVPTAVNGQVTVPAGFDPVTPPPQQITPELIQAVSAMAAGGNKAAGGALGGLQFQYQDRRATEREQRAEQLAMEREARSAARASAPKPQAPLEIERLLDAAGFQPGSPERQDALRQYVGAKINPKPGVSVNVGGGEGAFAKALGEQTAKQIPQYRDDAMAAEKSIEASRRVVDLLDKGAITGLGADWRMTANRVLGAAGLVDGQRVKNTEALVGELARGVLAAAGDMKGALSDKDVAFLREVAQGSIALTEATLRRAASLAEKGNMRLIQRYNDAVAPLSDDPNMPAVTRNLFAPLAVPGLAPAAAPPQTPPAPAPNAGGWAVRPAR